MLRLAEKRKRKHTPLLFPYRIKDPKYIMGVTHPWTE